MNSLRHNRPFMSSRMVQAIAILFLIYTAAEITCPQFCSEVSAGFTITAAASDRETARSVSSTETDQSELPAEPCTDEDCFCCCGHVVPGRALAAIALSDRKPDLTSYRKIDLASPPLKGPYHPPRLA